MKNLATLDLDKLNIKSLDSIDLSELDGLDDLDNIKLGSIGLNEEDLNSLNKVSENAISERRYNEKAIETRHSNKDSFKNNINGVINNTMVNNINKNTNKTTNKNNSVVPVSFKKQQKYDQQDEKNKDIDKLINQQHIEGKGVNMESGNTNRLSSKFSNAKKFLKEAEDLIAQNTIDSLLRYFQTGIIDGKHLPSIVLNEEKTIHRMLAHKLSPIVNELGLKWDNIELKRNGKLVLEYVKDEYTLEFATINPYERTLVFHFDFTEMEREREIELHKIKHQIRETMEKFRDTKRYLDENSGIKKLRNKKAIERLEGNIRNIADEITLMEQEVIEINQHKTLLEEIKEKVPEMEYELRKFGFIFEYVKGEQYEV